MLPVKLKLVFIKNILSRWLHIGCLASHIIFTCWPTQRVGLSHFCFFLLADSTCWPISFFLLANSTCWPISFFFTGQLNLFFLLANSTCWPFIMQPDGSHRLLLVAFPHAREILLEVLAIDRHRKFDTIQFLKHVCISRQNLINLVWSMPSRRPLTILPVFSSQW